MIASGGVFHCPDGYWSFALFFLQSSTFGHFFDSAAMAESELLRHVPVNVSLDYWVDSEGAL